MINMLEPIRTQMSSAKPSRHNDENIIDFLDGKLEVCDRSWHRAYAPKWRANALVDYLLPFPRRRRYLTSVNSNGQTRECDTHTLVKHVTHLATPGVDNGVSSARYVAV
jgi:hypothetical protein